MPLNQETMSTPVSIILQLILFFSRIVFPLELSVSHSSHATSACGKNRNIQEKVVTLVQLLRHSPNSLVIFIKKINFPVLLINENIHRFVLVST
jgi:hypothetical protein